MRRLRGRRGVVLVQVLTMSVILSTIAMMLIQWQYGRYVMAYRIETSHRARTIAESALYTKLAVWADTAALPSAGTVVVNDPVLGNVTVTIATTGCAPYNVCVTLTTD